jgi:hypothetical protein
LWRGGVERENLIEPMHLHGGHEAGIVHLRTNNIVRARERSFAPAGISVRCGHAEAKAIHNRGPRAHIPELSHVPRRDAQHMLFSVERLHRLSRRSTRRVAALNGAD